jgi:hypothetical protein
VIDPRRHPALTSLGEDTAGAVSLRECREADLSDAQTRWLVETGRWQSPYPRVYVTFSGPIPRVTLEYAALIYAGDGAVLSHDTAGYDSRLCRESTSIHITVPYPREVQSQPGLVIHRSRTLTDADIHPALSPRRTRVERTVLDLLADCRTTDAAIGLAADSVQRRATTVERLRAALIRHPKTRWRCVLLEVLPDIGAGAHSALEVRDAKMRRRHGLPAGTRQFERLSDGTEWLDILIEEYCLHIELDGRLGHIRARETWRDMRRDNRSEVLRLRHLRYGWTDMIDSPCEVAIQQAVILRQQGWRGDFKRCRSCPDQLPQGL